MPGFTFEAVEQTEVGQHWGWFLTLGIFMVIIGTLALGCSMTVTLFSMLFLGWMMIFAGIGEVVHAFWKKKWDGIFMHIVVGILYVVVGFMVLANPGSSAVTLTLLMAIFFILTGIFRFILALWTRLPNWGWEFINGIITLILGILIWEQWPVSGLWVIGLFLGIDLIISGWAWIMLSLAARQLRAQQG
jgi:uncharacterized membrane protein HdeD (DUF308 family)